MERLREQSADFVEIEPERPLQMGDFAVIDFEGTIEGQPIREIAPEASKNLQGGKKFWLRTGSGKFSAEVLRTIDRTKKGGDTIGDRDLSGRFAGKRTGGKESGLRRHVARDQTKGVPELNDTFAAKLAKDKTLAELRQTGGARSRAREGACHRAGERIANRQSFAGADPVRFAAAAFAK